MLHVLVTVGLSPDIMARYDEDLHENLFFNTLVSKYSSLFSEAADNKWMVSLCMIEVRVNGEEL